MIHLDRRISLQRALAMLLAVSALTVCGPAPLQRVAVRPARAQDAAKQALSRRVNTILRQHGPGIRAGLWLGGASGDAWFEQNAGAVLPTASSIKTFVLVELFAKHRDHLDAPIPGINLILDDEHPAISHFSSQRREEIRQGLRAVSVRSLGQIMIERTKASNVVYNAAANVAIALLGGPQAATQAIHDRDPAFASVVLNRYMLTDREKQGDNELKPSSLAALYQRLASKLLEGIDPTTMLAVREVLSSSKSARLGQLYYKGGTLSSKPATVVRAGWWETPKGPIVFVVMTVETTPNAVEDPEGAEAFAALSKTSLDLSNSLVNAGFKAMVDEMVPDEGGKRR